MSSSLLRFRPKVFVRASSTSAQGTSSRETPCPSSSLSGKEAKGFYEDVLQSKDDKKFHKRPRKRSVLKAPPSSSARAARRDRPDKPGDLFAAAQSDQFEEVRRILSKGQVEVDALDVYGWTPLMAAACAGATEAVEVLLEAGANASTRDKAGNTAEDLARRKGRTEVIVMLRNYGQKTCQEDHGEEEESFGPYTCETCKTLVTEPKSRHKCSTLHQFNSSRDNGPRPTLYGIPEANRGFQMMLESGWDRDRGLGPQGKEGKKFPVRTTLKRDRLGLGAPGAPRPKVTHFAPNDPAGVEDPRRKRREERAATVDKRNRQKSKRREAAEEKMLRQELSGL